MKLDNPYAAPEANVVVAKAAGAALGRVAETPAQLVALTWAAIRSDPRRSALLVVLAVAVALLKVWVDSFESSVGFLVGFLSEPLLVSACLMVEAFLLRDSSRRSAAALWIGTRRVWWFDIKLIAFIFGVSIPIMVLVIAVYLASGGGTDLEALSPMLTLVFLAVCTPALTLVGAALLAVIRGQVGLRGAFRYGFGLLRNNPMHALFFCALTLPAQLLAGLSEQEIALVAGVRSHVELRLASEVLTELMTLGGAFYVAVLTIFAERAAATD